MAKKNAKLQTVKTVVEIPKFNEMGLRGMGGLIYGIFEKSYAKTKDLSKLPSMSEIMGEVKRFFPQSKLLVNPKNHYSCYKSRFMSRVTAK